MKKQLIPYLVAVFPLVAGAAHGTPASDAGTVHPETLELSDEMCRGNCLVVFDYGTQQLWYYADGVGKLHLDYVHTESDTSVEARSKPLIRSAEIDAALTDIADASCGDDGWGWRHDDLVSRLRYPNETDVTIHYVRAGHGQRVTIDGDGIEKARLLLPLGIKPGTPDACAEQRGGGGHAH